MFKTVGKLALAGAGVLLAGVLSVGAALATPACTSTLDLGPSGSGLLLKSSFTSGFCVLANDKLYGNFNLSGLPASTVVTFNLVSIGPKDYYQIAFGSTYATNTNYNWSFEVAVMGAPPGTAIVELQSDFTQTAGGPSRLTETLTPGGLLIDETKNATTVTPTSITQVSLPALTDIVFNMHLHDKGTISSVTNTIVQLVPGRNIPEPLTLSLFGAGLAGLSMVRRKRRD